jgi:hypothetical protein
VGERHSPRRHQLRLYSTNELLPQTISGENLIPTVHHSIREREPLLRPDATAIDGRAMAEAARGTIARPGTVIANVMLHLRADREITKKKKLSMYPLSFHGSLAHFRVRASLMVCCFIQSFLTFLESSDYVFVGPVFRTDDLMQVFRGAVIPSVTGRSRSPPPAPRAPGECHYYFS